MIYLLQHALMESAERYPEGEAVVFGDRSLSYAELDRQSSQLANALRAGGARSGDRIGLLTGKCVEAIVGIHGILKAGCAYVPLDPRAPLPRLRYVMNDCGIERLVVSDSRAAMLGGLASEESTVGSAFVLGEPPEEPDLGELRLVSSQEIAQQSSAAPDLATIETDLAYLLYTSGSTGVPKGVMISHLASLTFVRWGADVFDIGHRDRLSNHAPLHFDLSIFDIFCGMLGGAAVAPVPEGTSTFPATLADWMVENRISVWYSVPSILAMLIRQGKLERHTFPDLRAILFAGEVFPPKYLRAWMEKVPDVAFYNLYGPTETNVITYHQVSELPTDTPVPIGAACANTQVFAVTGEGTIAGVGEEGELWARGSCLADGYWGDPNRTSEVFLPNRFDPQDPHRVYRTGDLVRLREDGGYEFLGRIDHMIKRRGYRIELGEIESALYSHEGVKEAAVIAEPDAEDGTRLTAYVVVDPGAGVESAELEGHLARWLPKYIIPDEIVFHDSLPKTSTGKVDRQALATAAPSADELARQQS